MNEDLDPELDEFEEEQEDDCRSDYERHPFDSTYYEDTRYL